MNRAIRSSIAIFLVPVLIAGLVLFSQSRVRAATLEHELAGFIYLHPLVKAGKSATQSAEQVIRQSKAGYLPTLATRCQLP